MMRSSLKFILLFALLFVGYLAGVFVPLMDNDAAHHAAIALNMYESGNAFELIDVHYGTIPYLDKPHFQMWAVAASFNAFGIGGVVYKLSSLLFVLLSIFATYKIGEMLAPRRGVGLWSAIILTTMTGFALNSSVDIRMDAIFSGAVALAIWQGLVAIGGGGKRLWSCVFAALGMAMAFATKGLYGVVVPALVYFFYMVGTGNLKWLLTWRFWAIIGMFGIFITPVLMAFYSQWGVDGVEFILIGQIFSRIGGDMGTSGASDPLFYIHTLLWVLLPWCAIFYIFFVRAFIKRQFDTIFWATIPPSVVMILMLSFSVFKLPHYLNPLFPLMAIFTAHHLLNLSGGRLFNAIKVTQRVVVIAIVIATAAVSYWVFPISSVGLSVLLGGGLLALVVAAFRPLRTVQGVALLSAAACGVMWVALNGNFYPQLMTYQAGNIIGQEAKKLDIKPSNTYLYDVRDFSASFDIYHGTVHKRLSKDEIVSKIKGGENFYLFVESAPLDSLRASNLRFDIVTRSRDYRITRLTGTFLNPATRPSVIDTVYLLKF